MSNSSDPDDKPLASYARPFVIIAVLAAFAMALPFALDWPVWKWRIWTTRPISLGPAAWFIFLALMPLFLITIYHVVTAQDRLTQAREVIADYVKRRDELAARIGRSMPAVPLRKPVTKGPVSALAATAVLSSVFLFVGFVYAYVPKNTIGAEGIVYAGLGAYVSVMYAMINRLFATAITSRFLMASALHTAAAVVIGFAFSTIGVEKIFTNQAALFVLFLVGLFQSLAFKFLRKRAGTLFGQPEPAEENLPLTLVSGIDEISADLLTEYGVTDVQHLATAEPAELCTRTLLPFLRVLGWIDQAMLIFFLGRKITDARACGVTDMTTLLGADDETTQAIASKTGLPLKHLATRYKDEFFITLIKEFREGSPVVRPQPIFQGVVVISSP